MFRLSVALIALLVAVAAAGCTASNSSSVYVVIDDPDALHDRAVAAGGEIVRELVDLDYGSRDFAVRDPEGNLWNFGTYAPEG